MKNNIARKELELLYGCRCFVTGRIDTRTFHHLLKKQFGGQATVENGVVLNRSFHDWVHSLEHTDKELFYLINECLDLAKKVIDIQNNELMCEWEELKPRLTKESNKRR